VAFLRLLSKRLLEADRVRVATSGAVQLLLVPDLSFGVELRVKVSPLLRLLTSAKGRVSVDAVADPR